MYLAGAVMRRLFLSISIFSTVSLIFLQSCRSVTQVEGGRSFGPGHSPSTLIFNSDSSFQFSLLDPGSDVLMLPNAPMQCFSTKGNWKTDGRNRWTLHPQQDFSPADSEFHYEDSVSHFINISSFQFLDRFGNPVPIRGIQFGKSKTRPHFGNSLFFFSQDFATTDTIRFYFDGYPTFSYPGSLARTIGNNGHKINFYDPFLPAIDHPIAVHARKGGLYLTGSPVSLRQKK